jgi:hypothetical protein
VRGTPVLADVTVSASGAVIAGIGKVGASPASWTLSVRLFDRGASVLARRTNHRGVAPERAPPATARSLYQSAKKFSWSCSVIESY